MADLPFRGSIRLRITALAAVLAAVILGCASVALVALQRQQLTSNLDNSLEQRADTYESTLIVEADSTVLSGTDDEDRAIQLVGAAGEVVLSTPNIAGLPPLVPTTGVERQAFGNQTLPLLEDDVYRILSRRIELADGPAVLHVAQNTDDLNDALRGLGIALLVAVPAVVAVLAILTWWLVGRTLLPVDRIRAEVAEISGSRLDRRVPVSGTDDEIARLASTMNGMLDRLDQAARRQRQFVADASHELRTPLTRIRTEVEVDLDQPGRADPLATNRAVLEESIALQNLLDNLLFLARSDESQLSSRREPVDLDDIVRQEATTSRRGSTVAVDTTAVAAAHLDGDPHQLGRVVRNLLDNAIRHAASAVAVSLTQSGDEAIELIVSDDGPGVAPEDRERIFERFARLDDARSRSEGGTGLGLAIVRDIVARHGGRVVCEAAPDGGARFIVTLPPHRRPTS